MFDCHYDLLTYILMRKSEKNFLKKYCNQIYHKDNIIGGIFNLFYMSPKEMYEELGISENQINLVRNLQYVTNYIETNQILPKNIQYIFGIEGLDYLERLEDIDTLYALGLRSVNPVWSNQNKFGAGVRASNQYGLTTLGEALIKNLVEKGIAIDLSHANETTFFDIVNLCKKLQTNQKKPIVFASHSNVKAICNHVRNLTDEQILAIKQLNGIIGVVSIKNFCIETNDFCNSNINYEQTYIEHILYIQKLLGDIENIAVATDDMKYYFIEPEYYQNINVYPHSSIRYSLEKNLKKNHFSDTDIQKILEQNFKEKILNRLNNT